MGEERRRKSRVQFMAQVRLKPENDMLLLEADVKNISMNGMYVISDMKVPVGTMCEIEIVLSGLSDEFDVSLRGKVVRHDQDGFAVEFEAVDIDSLQHLKNIIMYNSGEEEIEEETRSIK